MHARVAWLVRQGASSTHPRGRRAHFFCLPTCRCSSSLDQLGGSLPGTFTFTAIDATGQAVAQQIGRNLTGGPFSVNVVTPGTFYPGRNRQLDLSFKKILRFGSQRLTGGLDIYNVMNQNTILFYNTTFIPGVTGYLTPFAYMNPRVFRLAAEYAW